MSTKIFNRRGGFSYRSSPYRSGLEDKIALQLKNCGIDGAYEKHKIDYVVPASTHTYTPDFVLPNGIIVEGKGIFDSSDRSKHLLVKKQYPNLDIRFVFSNPANRLYKGSKTTYATWCEKNGYKYAKQFIPEEWLKDTIPRDLEGLVLKKK